MHFNTKKVALMGVLTSLALIIFVIESQIPLPVPVPGAKLGLANAVTLFALFFGKYEKKRGNTKSSGFDAPDLQMTDVFMILVCRIILGAVFTGRVVAFIYSISGGIMGFAAQAATSKFVSNKQIWVCGAIGAIFHNVGQILAAMFITATPAIAAYLPILTISAIITGVITGLAAQASLSRISRM